MNKRGNRLDTFIYVIRLGLNAPALIAVIMIFLDIWTNYKKDSSLSVLVPWADMFGILLGSISTAMLVIATLMRLENSQPLEVHSPYTAMFALALCTALVVLLPFGLVGSLSGLGISLLGLCGALWRTLPNPRVADVDFRFRE